MFQRSVAKWAGLAMVAATMAGAVQAQAPAAGADPAAELKRGRLLYIQCRACHELKADQPHKVGPNLHGMLGRKAAAAEGFAYSAALKGANLTWDKATLDKWIEKPSAVVPGNAMAFAGVANPKDRAALIAYIEAESK
ncbi:MAG: cytochrome c family protein [Steroidobacteraceae bacterium]|jgi:cytochrome c|nr:cytochrome c family protein [Steroidobacteraceae bacterium]